MSNKVLLPSVKVKTHGLILSVDKMREMETDELYARIYWLKDKAREIMTAKVDSKNIKLLAEIRETAKVYAREAIRTQMFINVRETHFNGYVHGKSKAPIAGLMLGEEDGVSA